MWKFGRRSQAAQSADQGAGDEYLVPEDRRPRRWSWRSRPIAIVVAGGLVAAASLGIALTQTSSSAPKHPSKVADEPTTTDVSSTTLAVSDTTIPDTTTTAAPTTTTTVSAVTIPPARTPPTTLAARPTAPVDVIAYTDPGGSQATVSWQPGPGGPLATSYAIESVPPTTTVTTSAPGRTATLTGLSPTTAYTITVRALDAAGTTSTPGSTILVNGASPGQASAWSQDQGTGLHSGQSADPGPHSAGRSWTWNAPSGFTVADISPLVGADGDVYVEGYNQGTNGMSSVAVYVLSPSTQQAAWSWTLDPGIMEGAITLAPDGGFYFDNPQGVYSIAPGGTTRWQIKDSGSFNPPGQITVGGGTLYFQDDQLTLWALDAASGTVLWKFSVPKGHCTNQAVPAMSADGKTVYTPAGDGHLDAVSAGPGGGHLEWQYAVPATTYAVCIFTPAVGPDGSVYLGWVVSDSQALSSTSAVDAIDPSGHRKWRVPTFQPDWPAITATGLVVFGDGASVKAVHARDGAVAWTFQMTNDQIVGPPAIARDGTIYLAGESSITALTNTGSVLWQTPESSGLGRIGTALALDSHGTLYAAVVDQNNNGKLVAFQS